MSEIKYIDTDFVIFRYKDRNGKNRKVHLAFGDKVEVFKAGKTSKIKALELWEGKLEGTVKGTPFRDYKKGVLKFSMVDVQQGDGMILETPPDKNHNTKLIFIDGGDNKLFARHAAARFRHRKSTKENPLPIDLMLITHGDADHFNGLTYIKKSETARIASRKRLFINVKRIYHNGLVKGPGSRNGKRVKEVDRLGETLVENGSTLITSLYEDPRTASIDRQNRPFKTWFKCIDHWENRGGAIDFKRIAHGMDEQALFGFLAPYLSVAIQGPFQEKTKDAHGKDIAALAFLHARKKSSLIHLSTRVQKRSLSASHTINGHSIALKLSFKNVRFSLTGDLNQEAMAIMRTRLGSLDELETEILKAPHHGSSDFDFKALQAMNPVVSLISSGDETSQKEYIHPRATLMAALGKVSRGETAIVLSTELAAFFAKRDYSHTRADLAKLYKEDSDKKISHKDLYKYYHSKRRSYSERNELPSYYGFEKTNFGIIHIRTDGERVLVFTHSGKKGMYEAYSFNVTPQHEVHFNETVSIQ